MYHVLEGIPFNIASMMVTYIGEATEKNRFSLSYSMVPNLLFRESGIDIPEGELVKNLRHTDYCNEATLHRMRYKKEESSWVRSHPTKQSTFIIQNDLSSSTTQISKSQLSFDTQILEYFEALVNDTPSYSTNVQIILELL